MKKLLVVLSFAFAALVYCPPTEDDACKARVQQESDAQAIDALLSQTSEVELISIDPTPSTKDTKPDDRILGRAMLREKKAIAELRTALVAGIRENQGTMLGCWDPRHGLKFKVDGREVTLTICFHCEHGYVTGVAHLTEIYTSRSPQAVFDRVFKQTGLRIAK